MIFRNGLPRPSGVTDFGDSAHAAGMLATFNSPDFDKSLIKNYISNRLAVRNPDEFPSNNPLNFTRDQLIPLISGLKSAGYLSLALELYEEAVKRGYRAQNTEYDVPGSTKKFPNGADFLTPSVMNHLLICSGQKPKLLGKIWLTADILFFGLVTPMSEPNNIIIMCLNAGPFYVKLLRKLNPKLNDSIRKYWSGWRQELEFAEFIIKNFQGA